MCMRGFSILYVQREYIVEPSIMLDPGFTQSAEHEGTVMGNGYPTELHTYSERERKSSQVIHCSLA